MSATGELIEAARRGDIEKVRDLMPTADPKVDDSMALFWAAHRGNVEMVKLLLPVSDAWAYHNEALRIAYLNKHWAVVELLLPHCDPTDAESIRAPVAVASALRRPDIISVFLVQYPKLDVRQQLQAMTLSGYTHEQCQTLKDIVDNQRMQKALQEAVCSPAPGTTQVKKPKM